MNWIFYETQEQAETSQNIIFENRCSSGLKDVCQGEELTPQITTKWAMPRQRQVDGLWGFLKPTVLEWLDGVDAPIADEEYNSDWFSDEGGD